MKTADAGKGKPANSQAFWFNRRMAEETCQLADMTENKKCKAEYNTLNI